MYNNPYGYNPQLSIDRINNQIAELEKLKQQMPMQQPANVTQNFQIAPTQPSGMKYANTLDEVKKEMVIIDTPFFSRDLSVMWLKTSKGEIRAFELNEIMQKDNKDILIESLQNQLSNLSKQIKEIKDEHTKYVDKSIDESIEDTEPQRDATIRKSTKKQ